MISPVMPTYARAPMTFDEGKGSWLVDIAGKHWLDAGAGIAVNVLGHAHPQLVKCLTDQASKLWHTSNLYCIQEQERLAEMLVEKTFADTVFFTNSGAEACEAAVKIARRYWHVTGQLEKKDIITFQSGFHGRTLGMISAAGSEKLTTGFSPLLPGFTQVEIENIDAVRDALTERTAAIMLEPVQGEGGIVPLSDGFLKELREFCDQNNILMILDEIQCGMGRTGKLFAHEWSGIKPDIMAIGKGIGGGFPLGACLATESAAKGMTAGTHGSTYGGNPLACRIGQEVLKIVGDPEFLEDVSKRAGFLRQNLESVVGIYPDIFSELRGSGMMLGLVCKLPNVAVIKAAYEQRLLTVPAGGNVVRILPALNMDRKEISIVCEMISAACSEIRKFGYAEFS